MLLSRASEIKGRAETCRPEEELVLQYMYIHIYIPRREARVILIPSYRLEGNALSGGVVCRVEVEVGLD